jgi:hypothetical protein
MSSDSIQGNPARADVGTGLMEAGSNRRTVVALISASVISIVVWGLVVVLHIQ